MSLIEFAFFKFPVDILSWVNRKIAVLHGTKDLDAFFATTLYSFLATGSLAAGLNAARFINTGSGTSYLLKKYRQNIDKI